MRRLDENPIDPEIAAQLDAIDATLAGEPVDPQHAELAELALLLAAERPAIDPEFAARDGRARGASGSAARGLGRERAAAAPGLRAAGGSWSRRSAGSRRAGGDRSWSWSSARAAAAVVLGLVLRPRRPPASGQCRRLGAATAASAVRRRRPVERRRDRASASGSRGSAAHAPQPARAPELPALRSPARSRRRATAARSSSPRSSR